MIITISHPVTLQILTRVAMVTDTHTCCGVARDPGVVVMLSACHARASVFVRQCGIHSGRSLSCPLVKIQYCGPRGSVFGLRLVWFELTMLCL